MSVEDTPPSESWSRKLLKTLVEHAMKTIIAVPVAAIVAWLTIAVGEHYGLIPCKIREWIWNVHCG